MQWLKPTFKSSLMALLGSRDTTPSTLKNRTEDIRLFILDELGEFGEKNYPKVIRHVRYALDAQGLWYARGDVMAVLAAVHGEYIAREKVGRITEKFEGLLTYKAARFSKAAIQFRADLLLGIGRPAETNADGPKAKRRLGPPRPESFGGQQAVALWWRHGQKAVQSARAP
jgi:hypothetical protein